MELGKTFHTARTSFRKTEHLLYKQWNSGRKLSKVNNNCLLTEEGAVYLLYTRSSWTNVSADVPVAFLL